MEDCARRRRELSREFEACRDALTALGDETRQRIFLALLEGERVGTRVPDIAERTHLSRPAVWHHLRILRRAGLVDRHREGTKLYYYVNADESQWSRLSALTDHIHAAARAALASGYPQTREWRE
ncbi:MAG: metalloregulator ArsR/SmtB family transcription factor [Fretibacterium sp.]|nr:metalloregulator ArsR/SmtB family transcription factor [Fretibacterium sp.]